MSTALSRAPGVFVGVKTGELEKCRQEYDSRSLCYASKVKFFSSEAKSWDAPHLDAHSLVFVVRHMVPLQATMYAFVERGMRACSILLAKIHSPRMSVASTPGRLYPCDSSVAGGGECDFKTTITAQECDTRPQCSSTPLSSPPSAC